ARCPIAGPALACESYALDPGAGDRAHARIARAGLGRAPSSQPAAAHLRRAERRSVFLRVGTVADLPAPRSRRAVRPDVRDGDGRARAAPRVVRAGTHHLRLLLRSRSPDLLFEYPARRRGVPPASRLLPRLRVGPVRLRHLRGRRRRLRRAPPDGQPGIRRGGDALARRHDDRVHVAARRRLGHLYDASGWQRSEAAHPHAGLRRGAVFFARRQATGAGVDPPRLGAARDEHLRRRLGGAGGGAPVVREQVRAFRSKLKGWDTSIVVAVVIWIVLRSYLIEAFRIPSASMENTLLVGDFLFVNKAIYGGALEIPFQGLRFLRVP